MHYYDWLRAADIYNKQPSRTQTGKYPPSLKDFFTSVEGNAATELIKTIGNIMLFETDTIYSFFHGKCEEYRIAYYINAYGNLSALKRYVGISQIIHSSERFDFIDISPERFETELKLTKITKDVLISNLRIRLSGLANAVIETNK